MKLVGERLSGQMFGMNHVVIPVQAEIALNILEALQEAITLGIDYKIMLQSWATYSK